MLSKGFWTQRKRRALFPAYLPPIEEAYKTVERGFKIINIGRDVGFLKQAAAQELQKARSHPKDMDT